MHIIVCAALLFAGCGLQEPLLVEQDPEIAAVREASMPKGWTLVPGESAVENASEYDEGEFELEVDGNALMRGTLAALTHAGLFSRVAGADDVASKEARTLVLDLKVVAAKAASKGRNGYFIPNIFFWWLLSPYAASLVADEDFEASMKVLASLTEAGAVKPLWQAELAPTFASSLDHFQRGITIWDLLPTGPFLAKLRPEAVSAAMEAHVRRRFEVELARKLAAELPAPETDLVLAVGAPVKDLAKYAPSDAQAVARLFESLPGSKEVVLLTPKVAAQAVRSFLVQTAKRTDVRIRDLRIFYAGPGTLVESKGALEQALRFADGATLPLAELLRLVEAVPAKTRTVLLDTGFYGQGGRAVSNPELKAVEPAKISSYPQGKAGLCLLCAAGPAEPGFESGSEKHGALTSFLLPLLSKKGDGNGDGTVKASEVFPELSWSLSRKVSLPGGTGLHPHLSGDAVLWTYDKKKGTGKKSN